MTNTKGFKNMNSQKQRTIARKGGLASSQRQDMSKLGQKGGRATQQNRRAHTLIKEEKRTGGKIVHLHGTAHEFNTKEAKSAGGSR